MNQIDLISLYIVCTPPPLPPGTRSAEGGGLASNQIFKNGGLARPQHLEQVAGKEGVTFFRGGFHIKNKLKSEIFNDKKSL